MRFTVFAFSATIAANVFLPGAVIAQDGFLFRAPVVTFNIRAGAALPLANDDLHRFFIDELTLDRRDFVSPTFGLDVAIAVSPRVDVVADISWARVKRLSESRDWVDEFDETIDQTTRLKRVPVSVGARFLARDRGRALSRFAWVPRTFLPYAGASVGIMWYTLEQEGWFVDAETLEIFSDFFRASGNTPMGQLFGGAEWWPGARFGLTMEGRYTYARAPLQPDYTDFRRIDLSGFQFVAGIATRF